MATTEIENGRGLSIEAVLASNQKRRCVLTGTTPTEGTRRASRLDLTLVTIRIRGVEFGYKSCRTDLETPWVLAKRA